MKRVFTYRCFQNPSTTQAGSNAIWYLVKNVSTHKTLGTWDNVSKSTANINVNSIITQEPLIYISYCYSTTIARNCYCRMLQRTYSFVLYIWFNYVSKVLEAYTTYNWQKILTQTKTMHRCLFWKTYYMKKYNILVLPIIKYKLLNISYRLPNTRY